MLAEILEPITTKQGDLNPGQLVELPEGIITKLVGQVRLATFEQVHEQLDRLGDWSGAIDRAATRCPDLLKSARQASRAVDLNPALIGDYFRAWLALFLAVRGQHVPA